MGIFCFDVTDFEKKILVLISLQMLFEGRYKTRLFSIFFFHLFSFPSFIFSKNRRGLILVYPQTIVYLYSKDGFTYGHSIQYKMLLVRLHIYRSIKT